MSVMRIEKSPIDRAWDSRSRRLLKELSVFFPKWRSLSGIEAYSTEVYWVRVASSADKDSSHTLRALRSALSDQILDDPLFRVSTESSFIPAGTDETPGYRWWCLEKSFRPGVTDNPGHVLSEAVGLVTGLESVCRSGARLWLKLPVEVSESEVKNFADEVFYNSLIERADLWSLEHAREQDAGLFKSPQWIEVSAGEIENGSGQVEEFDFLRMSSKDLEKLSNERLWALSSSELQCVVEHYQELSKTAPHRKVTDVEIEVIAQTWSEHCKHKIFAANIDVKNDRDDLDLPKRVNSVFKTYIRGATREIPASYLKSVFEDNAGVISVTADLDCAIKVETHNSPSALDPYGGALTGIVGVNRDILGVGLGAQPIANLDVFCVGPLDASEPLPPRLHHPRRILEGVRVGVEHGGNKSGIPTVTGAVVHHPGYLGKPLVFCGTIGVIPSDRPLIEKHILPGDKIVMAGGRIGKDGIHGATFSSLEMNESSPVSAVQLGDPLTQRRVWDFLIEARDRKLYRAVTDNGAGGLSSSIGELARLCGKRGGARMDVGLARTKYAGLKPYELVVSESQERMSFAVPQEKLEELLALAKSRGVECSVLGEFEDSGRFHILYNGKTVGELDMHFLHEGLPAMELKAHVKKPRAMSATPRYGVWSSVFSGDATSLKDALPKILASPNVRSRKSLVEQYDHEVQARSVRKPYGTPNHSAPNDGATLRLGRKTHEGLALGLGLAPFAAEIDPKVAAELALDEALRNAAVAGMDPNHAALVDNFCWPDPLPSSKNEDAEDKLGALVVTCKRIFDGAVELRMPFVSGKDSMKNDYRMGDVKISVPPTLLITAMGKVHDVRKVPRGYAVSGEPRTILWVSGQDVLPNHLGLPQVNFHKTAVFLSRFHELVREGLIESAHDVSDGGWLVATSEMLFGTGSGARLNFELGDLRTGEPEWAALFGEPATSFVLMIQSEHLGTVKRALSDATLLEVGQTTSNPDLELDVRFGQGRTLHAHWSVGSLEEAYHG